MWRSEQLVDQLYRGPFTRAFTFAKRPAKLSLGNHRDIFGVNGAIFKCDVYVTKDEIEKLKAQLKRDIGAKKVTPSAYINQVKMKVDTIKKARALSNIVNGPLTKPDEREKLRRILKPTALRDYSTVRIRFAEAFDTLHDDLLKYAKQSKYASYRLGVDYTPNEKFEFPHAKYKNILKADITNENDLVQVVRSVLDYLVTARQLEKDLKNNKLILLHSGECEIAA